jgi:hypothetical protein
MDNPWFYVRDGQAIGPVTPAELVELARRGALQPSDWVYEANTPNWVAAGQVPWLAEAFATPQTPLPPPPGPVSRWSNPVTEPAPAATADTAEFWPGEQPSAGPTPTAAVPAAEPVEAPLAFPAGKPAVAPAEPEAELEAEPPRRTTPLLIGGLVAAVTIGLGVLVGLVISGIIGSGDPETQISRQVDKLFVAIETRQFADYYRQSTTIHYREWNKMHEHLKVGESVLGTYGQLRAKTSTRFKYEELPTGPQALAVYAGEFEKGPAEIQVAFRKESDRWLLWDLAVEPAKPAQAGR